MKDAVATMGGILPPDAGGRDAVHVAVFSATADERMKPGDHVGIEEQNDGDAKVSRRVATIGLVDPFLQDIVKPGQRFWVYLYPRTITALSHRWSHPAFEQTASVYAPPAKKLESEQWLRDFCNDCDLPSYEDVMSTVAKALRIFPGMSTTEQVARSLREDYYAQEDYIHFDGQDASGDIPPEFWDHVEVVFGIAISGEKPKYFSCSC